MIIDYDKIILEKIAESVGLASYKKIMNKVNEVDVSTDNGFQKTFNGFYRVRRNEAWRKSYYDLFEKSKTQELSFEIIVSNLLELTGNVEASFASKMLATLDSSKPIWDRYVIEALGIKAPSQRMNSDERIKTIVNIYDDIEEWYKTFLNTDNAQEAINKFDLVMPDYTWISAVKKIDFFLWSIR